MRSLKTWHKAYLLLGSNIEPERNLLRAVSQLSKLGEIIAISQVWESSPAKFHDQPNFLNVAVLLETRLEARKLRFDSLRSIEDSLDRIRDPHNKNGPRTLDIDLVLFDEEIIAMDGYSLPSPEILERAYVAVPLAEIDPAYVHPEDGRTLHQIAANLKSHQPVLLCHPELALEPVSHECDS